MDIIDYDYDFIVSLLMSSDPTNYELYKSFNLPHDIRLKVWRRFMDELQYLMPYKSIVKFHTDDELFFAEDYFNIIDISLLLFLCERNLGVQIYLFEDASNIDKMFYYFSLFRLIYQKIVL